MQHLDARVESEHGSWHRLAQITRQRRRHAAADETRAVERREREFGVFGGEVSHEAPDFDVVARQAGARGHMRRCRLSHQRREIVACAVDQRAAAQDSPPYPGGNARAEQLHRRDHVATHRRLAAGRRVLLAELRQVDDDLGA